MFRCCTQGNYPLWADESIAGSISRGTIADIVHFCVSRLVSAAMIAAYLQGFKISACISTFPPSREGGERGRKGLGWLDSPSESHSAEPPGSRRRPRAHRRAALRRATAAPETGGGTGRRPVTAGGRGGCGAKGGGEARGRDRADAARGGCSAGPLAAEGGGGGWGGRGTARRDESRHTHISRVRGPGRRPAAHMRGLDRPRGFFRLGTRPEA